MGNRKFQTIAYEGSREEIWLNGSTRVQSQLPTDSVPYPLDNKKTRKATWLNPRFRNIIPYMSMG